MTNFIPHPESKDGLTKLSGTIRWLRVRRVEDIFVESKKEPSKTGVFGVAVATVVCLAASILTISSDSNNQTTTNTSTNDHVVEPETAHFVEFVLNGQTVKGLVWRNPFKEGDQVEVAAERRGDHWEAFGIACPSSRRIALFPHCVRAKTPHLKRIFKWWFFLGGGAIIAMQYFLMSFLDQHLFKGNEYIYFLSGILAFSCLIGLSYWWRSRPFVKVAQKVFKALDIPNPEQVDLVKSTKQKKTKQDPVELGVFYFKY